MASATIMDGKRVAGELLERTTARVHEITAATGRTPALATVLVGDDPASATYVRMKERRCQAAGMRCQRVDLPAPISTEVLVARIEQFGADPAIHGILLQHPVPPPADERAAFEAIRPAKDVDGVTLHSFATRSYGLGGFASATAEGMMRLLGAYDVQVAGSHAVVLGRSAIVGKPMAMLLLAANATVTICHSKTRQLAEMVRQADIVVAAVGKPRFVKGDWLKPGAVVLDAGYHTPSVGDVDFEAAVRRASLITPVPGGVGPMTIATLMDQTAQAAAQQLGLGSAGRAQVTSTAPQGT